MSSEEVKALIRKLMENYELTPDMEDDLKKLLDSVDEREGAEKVDDPRIADLEEQLRLSKQRYIDRFLNGSEETDKEEIEEVAEEDNEEHSEGEVGKENITDLFKIKED